MNVGCHERLTRVAVGRGCRIPDGPVVGEDAQRDAEHFYRSESGLTLITPEMLAALG